MALIEYKDGPIKKLIEVVSEGIGIIYEPHRIRRKADADAYKIEKLKEAENKGLISTFETNLSLAERAMRTMMAQGINRQVNIENIMDKSALYLTQPVSAEKVSPDWTAKFFNFAQDVSDDSMQEIWAKILAGEITKPNSVGIRTLNVLSNLTQKEAINFSKLSKISTNNGVIIKSEAINDHAGLKYDEALSLMAGGILNPSDTILYEPDPAEKLSGFYLTYNDIKWTMTMPMEYDFRIPCLSLTTEAVEIMNIIKIEKNHIWIEEKMNELKNDHPEVTFIRG